MCDMTAAVWAACLAVVILAAPARSVEQPAEDSGVSVTVDADGATPVGSGLKVLLKLYDDCSRRDGLTQCVKLKAATLLDRVARAGDLPITEMLTLVRRDGRAHAGRAMSEHELEAVLPSESYAAKDAKLNELLWDRAAKVFGSHSIQLSFPKVSASEMRGISSGGSGEFTALIWSRLYRASVLQCVINNSLQMSLSCGIDKAPFDPSVTYNQRVMRLLSFLCYNILTHECLNASFIFIAHLQAESANRLYSRWNNI